MKINEENSNFRKISRFLHCQESRKMIFDKAENLPVLCYYAKENMCKILSLFEIVNIGVSACEICQANKKKKRQTIKKNIKFLLLMSKAQIKF